MTEEKWSGARLEVLITLCLALNGPEVFLTSRVAVHLALVLHELGINSRKYGALSSEGGSVAVDWRVVMQASQPHLELDWTEHGGPEVVQPSSSGFGTELIERGMRHSLSGDAKLLYLPAGVVCRLTFPLEQG